MNTLRACAVSLLAAFLTFLPPACAQSSSEPLIVLVHPGIDALNADLLSLTNLAPEEEKAYGADLEAFIQDFALGLNPDQPVVVEVLTGSSPVTYLTWLPYADRVDFLDNLESIGFPAYVQPESSDFYLIDDEVDQGWLRLFPEKQYAVLSLVLPETRDAVREKVLQAEFPETALHLTEQEAASVKVHLRNDQVDAQTASERREMFQVLRADDQESLQQRPDEAATEFALRRAASDIVYDELERFYAEADAIDLLAHLDREESTIDVLFRAVAGDVDGAESLQTSLSLFGQTPDAFAAVGRLPNSVLSGRLNHPVDAMRQRHAAQYLNLLREDIHRRVDGSTRLTDGQKQATRRIFDDVVGIFEAGFASGNVNGFVEATHDGSGFVLIGAVSAPGSDALEDTLQQLPAAREGNEVELEVATEGDIRIHRIRLAEGFVDLADTVFGTGRDFYVGLGRDQVWMATGTGSKELLISAIRQTGEPDLNETVLTVDVALRPWAERLLELAEQKEPPEAVEDREAWRNELARMRQLAESLVQEDALNIVVKADGDSVTGTVRMHRGLLTFIGRQIAKLAKENLDL